MKNFVLIIAFVLATLTGFAQATPVEDVRIANATTPFGINLPLGTKVYNIADGKYWVATAGVVSTGTLTSASASFQQLNAIASGTNIGTGTITNIAVPLTSSTGSGVTLNAATQSLAGVMTASDKAKLDGIAAGAIVGVAPNSAITGATKTKITYDAKGLVTGGADATTADIAASTNKNYVTDAQLTVIGNTSGTNTGDNAVNSNYSSLVTNATHTGDVTGSGALTIAAGAVTLAKMANMGASTIMGNNTGSAGAPKALTTSETRSLLQVNRGQRNFEIAGDSLSGHVIVNITDTPVSGTVTVFLNSMSLVPTTQFTIVEGTKIRISLSAYQFDKISVAYSY